MATEVNFYHLTRSSLEDALPRLLQKTLQAGERVALERVGSFADGVAVRAGHHCAQPLMDHFDLDGTTRVSIAPYNDNSDIDALLAGVRHAAKTLR